MEKLLRTISADQKATVVLSDGLELALMVVLDLESGQPTAVDLRLHRRALGPLWTRPQAKDVGFRLPLSRVPQLCGKIFALAKASEP